LNIFSFHIARYNLVIVLLGTFICLFTLLCNSCNNSKTGISNIIHPSGKQFAGSESCKGCHESIFKSHAQTAHAQTSSKGNLQTVKGSFEKGSNDYVMNWQLKVIMEKNSENLYQVGYANGVEQMRQPIDMVVGSGTKGQTYFYWYGNQLFQLPVSYYTPLNSWCNSPGFPLNQIMFNRPVISRCLECHSTYAKAIDESSASNAYDKTQMINGITCERCHGPAADHVAYQLTHPDDKTANSIINPALLTRQQKLDNCALCHSGLRENSKPSFSYITGDKLDDYSTPDYKADSVQKLDVHGNQYGLLTASKCFKMSKMDCSSCHNVHQKETNNTKLFSEKCMACHTQDNHKFSTLEENKGLDMANNCISCHMPLMPSKKIFLDVSDNSKSTADMVRTHFIAIYNKTRNTKNLK
jgi:hypothetical protein